MFLVADLVSLKSFDVNKMYGHQRYAHVVFLIDFLYVISSKQETRPWYSPIFIKNYSHVKNSVTPDIAKIDYYSVYRGTGNNTEYTK